ncbi:hypothetical protein LUZ62_021060 [Rhynchospora pubera]|uniref:MI domain-containing protein n=1 Tax=Rhynchospora pubera TaxID=906938 RepID=A0AAV8GVR6_9POAL|nr:hypothetical protein LUZ62_021060 [Rhynchospora pubera]
MRMTPAQAQDPFYIVKEEIQDSLRKKKKARLGRHKDGQRTKSNSKFHEFLEMDMGRGATTAEEDLELERRLAKKLKVKKGKLTGPDDGINTLFEGLFSEIDPDHEMDYESDLLMTAESPMPDKKKKQKGKHSKLHAEEGGTDDEAGTSNADKKEKQKRKHNKVQSGGNTNEEPNSSEDGKKKKQKKMKKAVEKETTEGEETKQENDISEDKPVLSSSVNTKYVPPHLRATANAESEEVTQTRRRVRGLLNRLSEANVESITEEIAAIFRSVPRSIGCQVIGEEILASCARGPRGNEQYAAVFGAFVAGLACLVGVDFSAKFVASLSKIFEDEYSKEDSLSLRNLTLLLCYLFIFGVFSSELIYDLLNELSKRLTELDVATILTVLQCCGMKLRGDDPTSMKDFVLGIQHRVNEIKTRPCGSQDDKSKMNSKRMEFMLDTICDIKNNKKRTKEDPTHHTRLKKWLQKLRADGILLRGLKWQKLLDSDKKGQWWLSGDLAELSENVDFVATKISTEVLETQKLVQLAASQRMNTDLRRAIFCIIMSGEDYLDAFEKLLRLDLSGKQDREIMRVLVHCCLQEKMFNKYYTVLASKLCSHDKNHKFSLQYCLWDQFKELESMELNRSMNLAKFTAEMLANFSLSLAVLKSVDFTDPVQLTAKRIMHFRMLFEFLFEREESLVWNAFTRIAGLPELELLRSSILFFVKQYVVAANKGLTGKFKIMRKALDNVAGVLM